MLPLVLMSTIGLNFPNVPVKDGYSLIHSPEKWAAGAGVVCGLGRFDLRDVRGPVCCGKQCMVQFDALGRRFLLLGEDPSVSRVTISIDDNEPHTTIQASILNLPQGIRLMLYVDGEGEHLLEECRRALQVGLWSSVETPPQHPVLKSYRTKLGIQGL